MTATTSPLHLLHLPPLNPPPQDTHPATNRNTCKQRRARKYRHNPLLKKALHAIQHRTNYANHNGCNTLDLEDMCSQGKVCELDDDEDDGAGEVEIEKHVDNTEACQICVEVIASGGGTMWVVN